MSIHDTIDALKIWNEAVECCRVAAWDEVQRMEKGHMNASPARAVVRVVANQRRPTALDEVDNFSDSDFPQPVKEE